MSHPRLEHLRDLSCEAIAWEVFEAYAKKVIRNYGRNLHRDYFRRYKRECLEPLTEESLLATDQHFESMYSIVIGHRCYYIHSYTLYRGLVCLSRSKREAIILHYWELQTDEQLSLHFGVTSRTIRRWRQQSLQEIQHFIMGELNEESD